MKYVVFTWWDLDRKPELVLKDWSYMIYQKEKCPETGRLHYQGYVIFKNHKRKSTIKRMDPKFHFEQRKATHTEAKTYSDKTDSYVEGPWTFGDDTGVPETAGARSDILAVKKEIDQGKKVKELVLEENHFGTLARCYKFFQEYEETVLDKKDLERFIAEAPKELDKQWQKDLYTSLETQDRREVAWVCSDSGCMGKTQFVNWIKANSELTVFVSTGGTSRDIAEAYNREEIVIFDFTRDKKDFVNYSIIENFKDGKLFKPKYKSKMMFFGTRKVVVFANFPPEENKLSVDRINLITL